MAVEYRIRGKFLNNVGKYPALLRTMPDGTIVNLLGKGFKKKIPATQTMPAHVRTYRGATPADLKQVYEIDNQTATKPNKYIEKINKPDEPKADKQSAKTDGK